MRQCLRCGTPCTEIECSCGSRSVETRQLYLPIDLPKRERGEQEQPELQLKEKGGDPYLLLQPQS